MDAPAPIAPIEAQVDGHGLRFVVAPEERLQLILDTIAAARTSLQLYYYIFAKGRAGDAIADALIEARTRGVTVTLLVDGFGTDDQPDSVYAPLLDEGVKFARFFPRYGRRYLIRNHQKMLIADRKVAVIGGCNIEDSYFFETDEHLWWQDLAVRVDGPAALRLAAYFDDLERWMLAPKATLRGLNAILRKHSDNTGPVRWLFAGPFPRLSPLTRTLRLDMIRGTRLDMIHAYFTPNWGFLRKLGRLARRGQFRLITAAVSDNETTVAAARYCYGRLLKRGGQVFEYQPTRLHMKLIVVDDAVYAGSANFDMRSLYLNTEIMLRVEDAALAAEVRGLIDAHAAQSEDITRPLHKTRTNMLIRIRRFVAYLIITALDYRLARALNRNEA